MPKRVDHPIILGIVGDSASGKTTLSAGVAQILGEEHCSIFCTDDYHRYDRKERTDAGLSALDPRANYVDILEQHLRLLRRGEPVLKPNYCHAHGTLGRPKYFQPTEFVIAEGLLGYTTRAMRDCYDVKIFLDPEDDLRVKWKIHRDTSKRGYRLEEVVASLERRKQDSPNFIHPQRTFADIVLHLELARDRDGKPVDVLEINGNISDKRAERIEDLLWNLIPEAGHLRDQVGRIDVANGAHTSHPLALTQLLVGYHAVKAAMGVRAY
jgi:phosphoribulokinase